MPSPPTETPEPFGTGRDAAAGQGITPTGPWLTHHLRMDPATFDFEICVPVPSPVTAAGRGSVGGVRGRPGVEPRSFDLAHAAESPAGGVRGRRAEGGAESHAKSEFCLTRRARDPAR